MSLSAQFIHFDALTDICCTLGNVRYTLLLINKVILIGFLTGSTVQFKSSVGANICCLCASKYTTFKIEFWY